MVRIFCSHHETWQFKYMLLPLHTIQSQHLVDFVIQLKNTPLTVTQSWTKQFSSDVCGYQTEFSTCFLPLLLFTVSVSFKHYHIIKQFFSLFLLVFFLFPIGLQRRCFVSANVTSTICRSAVTFLCFFPVLQEQRLDPNHISWVLCYFFIIVHLSIYRCFVVDMTNNNYP